VELFLKSGKTSGEVSRDLDLTETSVRAWIRQAEIDEGKGPPGALTTSEREELSALKREVKTLRLEREIHRHVLQGGRHRGSPAARVSTASAAHSTRATWANAVKADKDERAKTKPFIDGIRQRCWWRWPARSTGLPTSG